MVTSGSPIGRTGVRESLIQISNTELLNPLAFFIEYTDEIVEANSSKRHIMVYIKKFFPGIFYRIVNKIDPT